MDTDYWGNQLISHIEFIKVEVGSKLLMSADKLPIKTYIRFQISKH